MRQKLAVLALALLAGCLASCSDVLSNSEKDDVSGTFQYTGYNQQGVVVVRGTITLSDNKSGLVNGRWNLQAVGSPDRLGPQVGQGDVRGEISLRSNGVSTLTLNLNPEWADNNVLLFGQGQSSKIEGEWHWSTLLGAVERGRFIATRN